MKSGMVLAAGLVLACLLAACTTQPGRQDRPEWVASQASAWPNSQYLTGRGSGPTLGQAESRARAALALILEARIDAEVRDQTRFEGSGKEGGAGQGRIASQVTRNISARTNQVVRGIEIADRWQDPASQEYHALAVLKRASAQQMLRSDILRLDQMTAFLVERSRASGELLAAIAAASRAVEAQAERLALQRMLQVIDRSGRGIPAQWSLARLISDRDALIGRISIQARAQNSDMPDLANRLAAALAHAGFKAPQAGEAIDYVLSVRLDVDDLGRQDGWFWLKGTLSLMLQDGEGRERGVRRWDIKQSGRDPKLAQRRVRDQVDRILEEDLRATIIDFASP